MDIRIQLEQVLAECERLRKENEYLKQVLSTMMQKNRDVRSVVPSANLMVNNRSSPEEKIRLFKRLFRGRTDVYAVRWESKDGRTGYTPACAYEWQPPFCRKPEIKCSECKHRTLLPLDDQVLYDHLSGKHTIGIYPMQKDETCFFLAIDFDKKNWKEDVLAFVNICKQFSVPYSIERSRSGNGAHVWIFFSEAISASLARKMGMVLLAKTLENRYELGLDSYDRLFPNQDTLPKGGFGNLIALPLQRKPRANGNSVFVDESFTPYPDQWLYLSSVQMMTKNEVRDVIRKYENKLITTNEIYPKKVTIELKNGLYVKKDGVSSSLLTKLTKTATFANPEFYKAQKSRLSTYGIPRVINCSWEERGYLVLPRGCLEEVIDLLSSLSIHAEVNDHRFDGQVIEVQFHGELTSQQHDALSQLLKHDIGILSATTGFGKTVIAAALIAERKVNTLVVVHRAQLIQQWIEQLSMFLNIPSKEIGQIGGGKNKITGNVDIATIQSLNYKGELKSSITQYGQIIIDECHHISAFSFEQVLKQIRAKYVCGLTATPTRKDGLHPIIHMQCGPVRYKIDGKTQAKVRPFIHRLIPRYTNFTSLNKDIQHLYHEIVINEQRNQQLFDDVLSALEEGRCPLVLTERIEHIEILQNLFKGFAKNIIVLCGKMTKKEKAQALQKLASIPDGVERLVIATGKYVGEGFDNTRLDTLFLAMPISWKGTLQQYVGRLHRIHANKQEVRVYDYVDHKIPIMKKMFEKRLAGYRAMGYIIDGENVSAEEQMKLF
ncbi:superfamily II DNA or RNA helicase [Anoxybacillus tepidamans]|uniref:Superfamily II DNA or RNA helicase n=1 Tax=Anoxybacteroides tepidamans TaxID=265948 RepID=A0A7W8MWF1_9BACL|nr:DEAD/DEAH box helicase [Anoxybacillus tepidamans]MBB5325888.1 superfamily II DNA or RNA helicase [Anoxybacillus tepidamans]